MNAHRERQYGRAPRNRVALLATFVHAAFSYWTSVFPRVCFYIARWRRRARRIPDPVLRQLALDALDKRGNIEGAAAFAAFAPLAHRTNVTRATSAFQAAYNLLDMLGEQPSPDPVLDGRRLHEALVYAVTPRGATAPPDSEIHSLDTDSPGAGPRAAAARALDWYEHHPQRERRRLPGRADRGMPRRVCRASRPPPDGALGTGRGRCVSSPFRAST